MLVVEFERQHGEGDRRSRPFSMKWKILIDVVWPPASTAVEAQPSSALKALP
jgi:hypothetical protein